jgi:hypothetical protein
VVVRLSDSRRSLKWRVFGPQPRLTIEEVTSRNSKGRSRRIVRGAKERPTRSDSIVCVFDSFYGHTHIQNFRALLLLSRCGWHGESLFAWPIGNNTSYVFVHRWQYQIATNSACPDVMSLVSFLLHGTHMHAHYTLDSTSKQEAAFFFLHFVF